MGDPTEKEMNHALTLLRGADNWEGRMAVIAIDSVCRWDHGDGPCDKPLYNAIVLLRDDAGVDVACFCKHHSACMEKAVEKWREMN